jgi:hypothetical protein
VDNGLGSLELGSGQQRWSSVHVADLAGFFRRALEDGSARGRLGGYFAGVLLLDQATAAAKAQAGLGWHPSRPSLTDEFRHGSYRSDR